MSAALTVVVGGGGVGKTTTSAALGLAFARQGRRTLVVTVDPARRLADALGVQIGIEACPICVDGTELWARMPDAGRPVDLFVSWLFDDPAARADRKARRRRGSR
jgi:anion-transporting  ArsA/GET3 family ATPase